MNEHRRSVCIEQKKEKKICKFPACGCSFIVVFPEFATNLIPAPTKNIGYSTERALNSTKSRESLQIYITFPGTRACALKRIEERERRRSGEDIYIIRAFHHPHKNIPSRRRTLTTHTSALNIKCCRRARVLLQPRRQRLR